MPRAFIGLGSNQGEPVENLKNALKMINDVQGITVTGVSSIYLTEPVGYEDQPWFHNCVAEIQTELTPEGLLKVLQEIENNLGRIRTIRWGPRTIDLDILLYDRQQIDSSDLTVPHPRMTDRVFVMVPLAELAGEALFPDGRTVQQIRDILSDEKKYSCIPQKIW